MISSPYRRRFKFSIRAMLIVVAVLSVWLSWNVRLVRERSALRKQMTQYAWSTSLPATQTASLSWMRRVLGDQMEFGNELYLNERFPDELVTRIQTAFPECKVTVIPTGATELRP